jgi:membrane associated rhomboid family serine protease
MPPAVEWYSVMQHPVSRSVEERIMTLLAVITILVGALQAAGGVQELVYQGVLNNRLYPLVGGTLGAVAGVFLLATGIALFRRSPDVLRLARATAGVSLPVFLLIGVIQPLAGRSATLLGLAMPLLVLAVLRRPAQDMRDSGGSPRAA